MRSLDDVNRNFFKYFTAKYALVLVIFAVAVLVLYRFIPKPEKLSIENYYTTFSLDVSRNYDILRPDTDSEHEEFSSEQMILLDRLKWESLPVKKAAAYMSLRKFSAQVENLFKEKSGKELSEKFQMNIVNAKNDAPYIKVEIPVKGISPEDAATVAEIVAEYGVEYLKDFPDIQKVSVVEKGTFSRPVKKSFIFIPVLIIVLAVAGCLIYEICVNVVTCADDAEKITGKKVLTDIKRNKGAAGFFMQNALADSRVVILAGCGNKKFGKIAGDCAAALSYNGKKVISLVRGKGESFREYLNAKCELNAIINKQDGCDSIEVPEIDGLSGNEKVGNLLQDLLAQYDYVICCVPDAARCNELPELTCQGKVIIGISRNATACKAVKESLYVLDLSNAAVICSIIG